MAALVLVLALPWLAGCQSLAEYGVFGLKPEPAGASGQANATAAQPVPASVPTPGSAQAPAAPAPDPDLQAERAAYDAVRTAHFPGVTLAQTRWALRTLFQLADPDARVVEADNGLAAWRSWSALPGATWSEAWWYAAAWSDGDGVTVRVRVAPEPDPASPLPGAGVSAALFHIAPATIDPVETTLAEIREGHAPVGVFLMRMRYLLRLNAYWLYCRAGEEYAYMEHWPGSLDPLCRDARDLRADRMRLDRP
ncbi:MAG: hypothetical protein AB7D57_01575 [Desulfovibrionaceae bacterium]